MHLKCVFCPNKALFASCIFLRQRHIEGSCMYVHRESSRCWLHLPLQQEQERKPRCLHDLAFLFIIDLGPLFLLGTYQFSLPTTQLWACYMQALPWLQIDGERRCQLMAASARDCRWHGRRGEGETDGELMMTGGWKQKCWTRKLWGGSTTLEMVASIRSCRINRFWCWKWKYEVYYRSIVEDVMWIHLKLPEK